MNKLVQQALDKAKKDIEELPLNQKNINIFFEDIEESAKLIAEWKKSETEDAVGIIAAKNELEELDKKVSSRVVEYTAILSEDINRIKRTDKK